MSTGTTGDDSHPGSDDVALARSPGFWVIVRHAVLLGVVLAFAALAFLGLVTGGTNLWFTLPEDPGWLDGSLWWVAVTAGTGVVVGVLRRVFRVPLKLPGTVQELEDQRVEPSTVPGAVAVSLVSLAGGASLGPEDALGKMGGGLGTWVSERQKLSEDVRATNTLSGMSGAYGGLLSSPILASILTLEIARPKAARFADALVAGLLAASVAFAVYFPIAGSTFVGIYALPSYEYEDWQLLAAVPLGLVAGALALITAVAIGVMTKLTAPLAEVHHPSPGHRRDRVRARRRRAAADAVHRNRSAHDRDPRRGGARRRPADRGRVREDLRVRALRGHRLHRWAVPRDAVHRRHGREPPRTC